MIIVSDDEQRGDAGPARNRGLAAPRHGAGADGRADAACAAAREHRHRVGARRSSRLDANLDGKIDDPGAAMIDAALAEARRRRARAVLGPLTDRLAALMSRDDAPDAGGSAYSDGWYGYVDKDLRTLLGHQ